MNCHASTTTGFFRHRLIAAPGNRNILGLAYSGDQRYVKGLNDASSAGDKSAPLSEVIGLTFANGTLRADIWRLPPIFGARHPKLLGRHTFSQLATSGSTSAFTSDTGPEGEVCALASVFLIAVI
jgi:hypothetical protein